MCSSPPLIQQVVEVQGAFLRAGVLGHADGEHRAPNDPGLNLRTRVDPDGCDRVIHRVEVVILEPWSTGFAPPRPEHHVVELGEIEPPPRLQVRDADGSECWPA